MAKICVSLADAAECEEVCAALRLKRHEVVLAGPFMAGESPSAVASGILAAGADVAVLDYLSEDAASVKVLQAATDSAGAPRFIFIMPDGIAAAEMMMAVNEGASALLARPVGADALANYVERAVSGPARFRREAGREGGRANEISEMEREARTMRTRLAAYRKLISFLMSTPAGAQHRSALIVSDSAYQRNHLKKLLEDHGFLAHSAGNPAEGLEAAWEHKPRVVISDLEMEGMNGMEFCRELKIVQKYMPCYFVICTANAEKIEDIMAPGNGVDACVTKPADESGNRQLIAAAAMGLLL